MTTIREIVTAHAAQGTTVDTLVEALVAREEEKVNQLLTVGSTQFGVEPIFAVKVLMDLELGEPKTSEMREYVNAQFMAKVREYQARQAGEDPGPEDNTDNGDTPEGQQS